MHFDAKAAKQLQPGSHLSIAPGLRLEARASKKTWIYRYRNPLDGRMKQAKIGEWPAMSPAAAIAGWEKMRAARAAGDLVATRKASEPPRPVNVRKVCDAYLVGHVERSRKLKGAKEVRRMLDTMLGDFANLRADKVTRAEAYAVIDRHAGIPVQASKLKAELGAAWDYAHDAGLLPETATNWFRLIMRGKLKSAGKKIQGQRIKGKRVLNESELAALIRWLPNFTRLVDDVLTLYLWTGTRGAEICAMEAHEVREESSVLWWTIPLHKTKNARREGATDLRVPLVGRARSVVLRRIELHPSGFLFPARGVANSHVEQKTIQTAVHFHQPYSETRPTCSRPRLTVTHWSPHDLRRSVRTLLSSMGCPREIAEAVLGHMQPGIVGVYDRHTFDAERLEWLTKLDLRLEDLANPRPWRQAGAGHLHRTASPQQPRSSRSA